MKILVFNGSPKREKSDTLHITNAFLEGMKEVSDQEIQLIHVIDKHIEYCMGCFACKRNGGTCIHNDDMRAILEEILNSDLLVFSFPLYCYSMPAPLKTLLDRTMPLSSMAMQKVGDRYEYVCQGDFSRLRYLMICGCGFPNSKHNFEPAVAQFKLCFPNNHTIITVPESPMFNAPEADVVTKPRLELIKKAGKQYAESGAIDAGLLAEIGSPMIPEEVYAAIANGEQRTDMITSTRLRIYPATQNQMEAMIASERNDDLKAAYTEMLESCLRHPDQWDWYALWIIERIDGTCIGDLCFKGLDANGIAEIGYGISEEYQGQGYATEAVQAVLAWAFRDPRVKAIEAETTVENMASQRVLEKCGFLANGKTGEEGPRYAIKRD